MLYGRRIHHVIQNLCAHFDDGKLSIPLLHGEYFDDSYICFTFHVTIEAAFRWNFEAKGMRLLHLRDDTSVRGVRTVCLVGLMVVGRSQNLFDVIRPDAKDGDARLGPVVYLTVETTIDPIHSVATHLYDC